MIDLSAIDMTHLFLETQKLHAAMPQLYGCCCVNYDVHAHEILVEFNDRDLVLRFPVREWQSDMTLAYAKVALLT